MNIPENARKIVERLQKHHSAYLVGGCVRDMFLDKEPKDYDICTSARPEEVMEMFKFVIPTGIKHGTVSVVMDKELYEVTTYRYNEIYENSHIPTSVSFDTSKEGIYNDLSRRDLTINAMAFDPISNIFIDPYGGEEDIKKGIIRTVGNPDERFSEDPLRMMRAIRFACQLGFTVDRKTFESIRRNREKLNVISAERINAELTKMVMSDNVEKMMMLHYSGLAEMFFPEFSVCCECTQNHPYHKASVGRHILDVVSLVPKDPQLRFAALFHDIGKPLVKTMDARSDHFYGHPKASREIALRVMEELRFLNKDKKMIADLVLEHDKFENIQNVNKSLKKLLNKYDAYFVKKLLTLAVADTNAHTDILIEKTKDTLEEIEKELTSILENGEPYKIKHLKINGSDLLERGYEGEAVGRKLSELLVEVLKNPEKNTREYLLGRCRKRN